MLPCLHTFSESNTKYEVTHVTISNISNTSVQCRVTMYDHDGNDVSTLCTVSTGGGISGARRLTLSTGVNTFEIPAHSTRTYSFWDENMPGTIGYGVIEWSSTDTQQRKSLIAGVFSYGKRYTEGFYATKYLVNHGEPF